MTIVAKQRAGQFAAIEMTVAAEPITDARVFSRLDEPYFEEILRGLRSAPPPEVLELLAGNVLPDNLPENIAGIAVLLIDASGSNGDDT